MTGVAFVGAWTEETVAVARAGGDASAANAWLIGSAIVHLLMLGRATVLSVFKPWGPVRPAPEADRRPGRALRT